MTQAAEDERIFALGQDENRILYSLPILILAPCLH